MKRANRDAIAGPVFDRIEMDIVDVRRQIVGITNLVGGTQIFDFATKSAGRIGGYRFQSCDQLPQSFDFGRLFCRLL